MAKYSDQSLNNIVSLFEDTEYQERKEVFLRVMDSFNKHRVNWAVGCSMNLFFRGIVDEFHDLDLIVDFESVETIKAIMEEMGAVLEATGGNGFCESDVYLHYQLGRVDIDVISGFRVMTFNTCYYYKYARDEIDIMTIEGFEVPLISLEAMYILYYMMEGWQPKRKFKRMLVQEYFETHQPEHPQILRKAVEKEKEKEKNLPGRIRRDVMRYL